MRMHRSIREDAFFDRYPRSAGFGVSNLTQTFQKINSVGDITNKNSMPIFIILNRLWYAVQRIKCEQENTKEHSHGEREN
jgi:hypothetical protein